MEWHEFCLRQAGIVSRAQLMAAGLPAARIATLARSGRIETTAFAGVYRARGAPATAESANWSAVLDANAVLSYLSAAQWWEVPVLLDGRIHVTAPERRRTKMPRGVRVHRVQLDPSAVTERFGMPITSRCETILDCLGWLPLRDASTLADRCLQQKWLTARDIELRLDQQPGRWGNRQLALLRRQSVPGAVAESERRLIRLLEDAGITGWRGNHPVLVGGSRFVLDIAFPKRRIAIEVDGWAHHSSVDRFRADRQRQNVLVASGWTVLRYTWWDITERPDEIVAEISALLAI